MRVARMGYITTKKGIKWVRIVVPDDLVSVVGKKNLMESLETKDNRVAIQRAPAVIAKFQQQIADSRSKLGGYVYVPARSHAEIVTRVISRGGFGGRMLLKSEAENLPAPDTTPVIIEPSREVIEAIHRARQKAEQPSVLTETEESSASDMVSWAYGPGALCRRQRRGSRPLGSDHW